MPRLVAAALLLSITTTGTGASAAGSCGAGGVVGKRQKVSFQGSVFYVTTPAGYTSARPWPLIFGLHGDEGSPVESVNPLWSNVTDDRFIFVAPQAPDQALPDEGRWYTQQDQNTAWMDALLQLLEKSYNIDLDRISAWGLSGGAIFLSDYILVRQDVYAAAEFNMGGGYDGLRYIAATRAECKVPARFVATKTDFLRPEMLAFQALLNTRGHQTVWQDASCTENEGHCFDVAVMGAPARDWLLAHTLCGGTPTQACRSGSTDAGMQAPDGGVDGADGPSTDGGADIGPVGGGAGGRTGQVTGGTTGGGGSGMDGRAGTGGAGAAPAMVDGGLADADASGVAAGCGCAVPSGQRRVPVDTAFIALAVAFLVCRRRDRNQ